MPLESRRYCADIASEWCTMDRIAIPDTVAPGAPTEREWRRNNATVGREKKHAKKPINANSSEEPGTEPIEGDNHVLDELA